MLSMIIAVSSICGLIGQVNNISPNKFSFGLNGNTYSIPYESSHTLGVFDPGLKYAVISLHGTSRNSDDYFSNMQFAASQVTGESDSTIILAPQFLTEADIEAFSLSNDYLYWTSGGWTAGSLSRNESSNPRPDRASSFQVLDSLIFAISQMGIEVITFVGHSAGAQVVQRYAATSPIADQGAITSSLRFIVMNPSSYVYLDNKRRVGESVTEFAVPTSGCTGYNEWKYGLDDMFSYPSASSVQEIRDRYKEADVVYVVGGSDNDPNDSSLDKDCEANLQGNHRLERATVYYNYIQHYYQEQIHRIDTVPNVGHSSLQMFASPVGVFHIFQSRNGYSTSTKKPLRILGNIDIYPNPVRQRLYFKNPFLNTSMHTSIHDMMGRTIEVNDAREKFQNEIDISALAPGLYILKLESKEGAFIQKFIKW